LFGFEMSGPDMALVGQKAENLFVGVNTGIMDQFVSRNGKKDHALFLDCRSLEYRQLPLDCSRYKVVVCNTMKRRGLVDSEYGARRAQCEEAVAVLRKHRPEVRALRDATLDMINEYRGELTEKQYMRARHVITENNRGLEAIRVLNAGDFEGFGRLMDQSHDSARDDYEVSCPELEAMVKAAREAPGSLSGRLAGAGFGGCAVSLVEASRVKEFGEYVTAAYSRAVGPVPEIWVLSAEDGAGPVSPAEL
ncbi:MAG: galactokinase, partial [Abditibacteriota bacterium]|nr:galactokinase [Abditibacteriota bacterium]